MNKEKQKQKLQKKYDNLSLVERNAYEQIVDRNTSESNWLGFPYVFMKLMTLIGFFIISVAIITGIPISTFANEFMLLLGIMIIVIPILMIAGIISDIIGTCKINKLKRKLLNG